MNQQSRIIVAILLGLFCCTAEAFGQELAVENVRARQLKDKRVVVYYDLIGELSKNHRINLSLFLPNSKETITLNESSLGYDIGKGVKPGRGKKIVWSLLRDYPKGLHGEGFVFIVDADVQKGGSKLPIVLGGLAAGVAAYIAIKPPDEPDTESVILPSPPGRPSGN